MTTKLHDLIPLSRVFLGDIAAKTHQDDTIFTVLQVTTAILKLLGYDKSHRSDNTQITPELSDAEKALWGKCAAVLIQDPKALETGIEAVSVRTLGTAYSTEARARFVAAASSKAMMDLKQMIRRLSEPFKSTTDNLDIDTLP